MLANPQVRKINFFQKSPKNADKGNTLTKNGALPLSKITKSDLLVYALILIVKAVVFAPLCVAAEKVLHLVLVERKRARILLGILVVDVEFAALTGCFHFFRVF